MRLLLINPKFPESFWSFRWAIDEVLPQTRAVNPPLGLATLAALCPDDWQVEIIDENIESVPLAPDADLIGVCGMGVQFRRQADLLTYYRNQGYATVAGGSNASLCPEDYVDLADTVIAGEAEYIWKEFCRDTESGHPKALYHETGTVDLADSPAPRFDLLKLGRYANATLQYSRGCPFRCEFCDIIVMFGRRPRVKSVEQVGAELDALRRAGVRSVFFVDDNLIGNRPRAKELLRFLARYQADHDFAFSFGTEASLDMAQDAELLTLLRAANFTWVFIGIESPDQDSLRETGKTQNLKEPLLTSIRKIYAQGIEILGGFIVGFDNDTLDTFELQHRFITESGIQAAMVGLLMAMPRTPLFERIRREGRLRVADHRSDNTRLGSNIVPKHMSHDAMVEAYQELYRRLLTDQGIAARIRNKMRYLRAPAYQSSFGPIDRIHVIVRLIRKGILPGGPKRIFHFLRTFPVFAPKRIPVVVGDWIIGLAMRNYAEHYLTLAAPASGGLVRRVAALRASLRRYEDRVLVILRDASTAPDLTIYLRGSLDSRFFSVATPLLRRMLRRTRANLTLHVSGLEIPHAAEIERLLHRLKSYGDRIFVVMDEQLLRRISVDSSVFNVVLVPNER